MKNPTRFVLAVAMPILAPFAAAAGQADEHDSHHAPAAAAAATTGEMSEGEVRKVNADTQKITLRHGELKNLAMPPMTMVFRVADPAMLEQVKAGDKVRFVADKVDGQFTIVRIEAKR